MKVLALSGGVGGAKLALGLARTLPVDDLMIVANTADDFEHLGLYIAPDLDSVMYTLAGVNDSGRGWGLAGETWHCLEALAALGGESWFQLGDRDLATHLQRTALLRAGRGLGEATAILCRHLGVETRLLPMSEDRVSTIVATDAGELSFQHYFVREQCRPRVTGFRFDGQDRARPLPAMMDLLADPALGLIVICPSNPFVSVDPILGLPGLRDAISAAAAPLVAVSPIVGGKALKGPAAKMLGELGLPVGAESVAAHYAGLVDLFVLDESDVTLAPVIEDSGMQVATAPTIMRTLEDREQLARKILELGAAFAR